MPRPIIGTRQDERISTGLSLNQQMNTTTRLSPLQVERKLREKRSQKYVETMKHLDAGGHTTNRAATEAMIAAIRAEMPEISAELLPIGIVAKCYLGPPYEVHMLEATGQIIRHLKSFEALPPLMERARGLAMHGGYEFIEVYTDCLRAIKGDGNVAVVKE